MPSCWEFVLKSKVTCCQSFVPEATGMAFPSTALSTASRITRIGVLALEVKYFGRHRSGVIRDGVIRYSQFGKTSNHG